MRTLNSNEKRVGIEFKDAVERALEDGTGMAYADFFLPQPQLDAIARQAARIPKNFPSPRPIRRPIDVWQNTERATLVPVTRYLVDRPQEVGALATLWVPAAAEVSRHFAKHIREVGRCLRISTLLDYTPNRVGINYMHGTPEAPALIGEHTDVEEEAGLVIAFDVSGGRQNGRPHLILGHDTCKAAGITQPPHEIVATQERMGMTIAQLDF